MHKNICGKVNYKRVAINSVDSIHSARLKNIKLIVNKWAKCNPKEPLIESKNYLIEMIGFARKQLFQDEIYSYDEDRSKFLRLYVEAYMQYKLISRSLAGTEEVVEQIEINKKAIGDYYNLIKKEVEALYLKGVECLQGVVDLCDCVCLHLGSEGRFEELNEIRETYSVYYPKFDLAELKARIEAQSLIDVKGLFGDLTKYDYRSGFLFFKCYELCKDSGRSDDAFLYLLMACSLFKGEDYYERKKTLTEDEKLGSKFKKYSIKWSSDEGCCIPGIC